MASALSWTPLRALGTISYGVYLWHWPVYIMLTATRTGLGDLALTAVRIAVTLAIATVSFFAIEQPVRRGRLRHWRVRAWAPAVAIVSSIAIIGATVGAAPSLEAATARRDAIPIQGPPAGVTKLMVVGDSVASAMADALKAHHNPWHVDVLNRSTWPCLLTESHPVVLNFFGQTMRNPPCWVGWPDDVNAYRPDRVLLTFAGDSTGDAKTAPCTPEYDARYRARLRAAIVALSARGAKVTVATPAYLYLLTPLMERFTSIQSLIRARIDCVTAVTHSVVSELHAAVIDLNSYVCPNGQCLNYLGGAQLRPDGMHYSRASGATVGHWVLTRLLGPA